MTDKYHSDTKSKIEVLSYSPEYQDSGDLEGTTKSITATSKQGTPDYTKSLTLPAPDDGRIEVKQTCARLHVTIDSFGGDPATSKVYYAVHVNGSQIITGEWDSAGDRYARLALNEGEFNLGSPTGFEIFLWVDQGEAVVSVCQFVFGVGSSDSAGHMGWALRINHEGFLSGSAVLERFGTDSWAARFRPTEMNLGALRHYLYTHQINTLDTRGTFCFKHELVSNPWIQIQCNGIISNIVCIREIGLVLRYEA